ncbi:hypothetical protein KSS87_006219 [Heliosperma pusillum]|nr:hypothetical protein KSS87_006219 [Heliosperma pusillum]
MLWSPACYVSGFQNLKSLHIQGCKKLRSLGSPSIFAALVQLEQLKIINCDKLQEVISRETEGGEVLEKAINFRKLAHLSLEQSVEIERFYRGSYNLKFPNLKSLRLLRIDNFTNFDGSENSTTLFSDKLEFPCLEELDVQEVSNNVLRLWNWSSSLMQGERENGSISLNPVPKLQILRLGKVHGFVTIPHSVSHKLSHLEVSDFDNIKFLFSVSTGKREVFCTYSQLPYLKNLSVSRCESLEQLFDGEDDDVVVSFCERLIEITLQTDLFTKGKEQLQLLESLEIEYCTNMEVIIKDEVVGGTNAPKLCKLEIDDKDYSKRANKELQFMLANLHNYYIRGKEEEEGGQSAGEMEELQNDGTQDESNNDGDEKLEELRTEV